MVRSRLMAGIRAHDEPSTPRRSNPTSVPIVPGAMPPGSDPPPDPVTPSRRRWWVFALGVAVGLAPIGVVARVLVHASHLAAPGPTSTPTSASAAETAAAPSLTIARPASSAVSTAASTPAASVVVPVSAATVLSASAPIAAAITAPASTAVQRSTTTVAAALDEPRPIPTFDDGFHVVGADIQPGRYILEQASEGCYWARLRDVAGGLPSIIANDSAVGQVVVDILATDAAFQSVGCGTWIAYLGAYPTSSFADGKWVVPTQVATGRWQAPGGAGCYWARLRDFADTVDSVIASQVKRGPVVVDIEPGDEGFESKRCGPWTRVTA